MFTVSAKIIIILNSLMTVIAVITMKTMLFYALYAQSTLETVKVFFAISVHASFTIITVK